MNADTMNANPINEKIDAYLRGYMADSGVVGLAIAVAQEGEMLFCRGYGVQDQRTKTPVTFGFSRQNNDQHSHYAIARGRQVGVG